MKFRETPVKFRQPVRREFATVAVSTITEILAAVQAADEVDDPGAPRDRPLDRDRASVAAMPDGVREVRLKLLTTGFESAATTWSCAADHLRALESDLRRDPPAIWSTMTLARAVMEAVTFTVYLTEPGISVEERLLRTAATWLEDGNFLVVASPPWHASHQAAINNRTFQANELLRGGFLLDSKSSPKRVSLDGRHVSVKLNATARAKLLLEPDAPEPYRLASGAAHARPWFLTLNATETAGRWTGQLATAAAAVVTAADVMSAGLRALMGKCRRAPHDP